MTPRFALFACALPKYRDHHRKLLSCRDQDLGAKIFLRKRAITTTLYAECDLGKSSAEIVVGPIVAGKWSVSAVNDFGSITTLAYWGDVTDECRTGGRADCAVRQLMEVVADGVGG
jgi:hypothetical protein